MKLKCTASWKQVTSASGMFSSCTLQTAQQHDWLKYKPVTENTRNWKAHAKGTEG